MDPKDLTPEERLLRLIRKGNPKENKPAQEAGIPVQDKGPAKYTVSAPAVPERKGPSLIFKAPELSPVSFSITNNFKIFEMALIGVFCLLTAYLIFDISNASNKSFTKRFEVSAKQAPELNIPKISLAPYNTYAGLFSGRNLFTWMQERPTETSSSVSQEDVSKAVSKLTLSGIVEGATTQAIIFDKTSNQTYFLKVGDSVGEFKLLEISPGKVVLDFKGEKVELFL